MPLGKASKEKLPRGVRRRGNSLVVSFALDDGRIERRALGMVSVCFAVEQLGIFRRQVREGTYEKRRPRVEQHIYTVADLWPVYLREYRNRGGRDAGRLEIAWNHLKPMFESMSVAEVSTDSVNRYIESRRPRVENATINRETALLRAMFRHGSKVTPPMVDRVPAFPTRLKENPPRKGFVTDREYAVLAKNASSPWLRCLIACAYSFGFRKGELLNLRVSNVDLLDRWIELEQGTTKNDDSRKVPMTGEVFELIRGCVAGKKPDDFVFTRADGSRVVDPREEWYSLCVSSGLGQLLPKKNKYGKDFLSYRGLNLHDFRRSAIRNMTRRGVSNTVAMKISGHRTLAVFLRYNITDERDLEQASKLIEAGRQGFEFPLGTDTKSDTSSFLESPDSCNSLN